MKTRTLITLSLVLIALFAALFYGLSLLGSAPSATVINKGSRAVSSVAGVAIGGPFELVDHTGAVRTEADFANDYKLVYFGFTYCPAICPTELQKITAVMAQLPEEMAAQIQPLFITIDPKRDTVAVLKDYVSLFHDRLVGLTGSQKQVDAVKKAYRVYAKAVQEEGMSEYTMDHSSYIYFMSPDDKLLGMYRIQDTPDYMITDMRKFF